MCKGINGIEITDVVIYPLRNTPTSDSKLKAFARVVLNDQFIISGLRIFEGKNGLFISFPQEYNKKEEKGYDVCFPITAEFRQYIMDQVLSQYSLSLSMKEETGE